MPAPTELGLAVPSGDPAELRDVARFLRASASALAEVATKVTTAASAVGSCWRGPAAYFFGMRVNETVRAIQTTPDSCNNAASTLERLATDLEDTRRRALAAETDAVAARQRRDAASYELTAAGSTAFVDPVTHEILRNRLEDAHRDLATARSNGERAQQDSVEAGRRAAAALNELADAVRVPPPPAGDHVQPYETTRQWWHRQLGEFLVYPLNVFHPREPRERAQIAFDLLAGENGGVIEGFDRRSAKLFQTVHDIRTIRGPIVVRTAWIEEPSGARTPVYYESAQKTGRKFIWGPDPERGGKIARIAKVSKYGGWAISGATAALDQWIDDRERHDLGLGVKLIRTGFNTVLVGGGAALGGIVGFESGAVAGTVVGSVVPGPGSTIGFIAGGVVGTTWGGFIGQAIGEKIKGTIFNGLAIN